MHGFAESSVSAQGVGENSLYVLPLALMPLRTAALRRAKLVKNARLESMVELFSGADTGSGQIDPDHLHLAFRFREENESDIEVVQRLASLSSYDVYSLRLELRRLGIEVESAEGLRLSPEQILQLSSHMQVFTRPLLTAVYGNSGGEQQRLDNIVDLFRNPNIETARRNLERLSQSLGVSVGAVPTFLEEYGDVYLSLSYYQRCLDSSAPQIADFLNVSDDLLNTPAIRRDWPRRQLICNTRDKLQSMAKDVGDVLEMFRIRTADMWEDMSKQRFIKMRKLISQYQVKIGAILCAVTVKMKAWHRRSVRSAKRGANLLVDFIRTDMLAGLDRVEPMNYADAD